MGVAFAVGVELGGKAEAVAVALGSVGVGAVPEGEMVGVSAIAVAVEGEGDAVCEVLVEVCIAEPVGLTLGVAEPIGVADSADIDVSVGVGKSEVSDGAGLIDGVGLWSN